MTARRDVRPYDTPAFRTWLAGHAVDHARCSRQCLVGFVQALFGPDIDIEVPILRYLAEKAGLDYEALVRLLLDVGASTWTATYSSWHVPLASLRALAPHALNQHMAAEEAA